MFQISGHTLAAKQMVNFCFPKRQRVDQGHKMVPCEFWMCDSDWAGGKELGAVRVIMDLGVHMGVPGWPHELLDLKKVAQHDPKVTEKCEK